MRTIKNSKKNERRILIASLGIAAVAVGSATFAWFTSKDEVTNRLSASANYNVSIAEDFTPPEDWAPGQKIDKKVSVVNTGNTDAFVRTWLEGEMRLLAQGTSALDANTAPASFDPNAVDDAKLKELGFTYSNGTGDNLVYLKELDNTKKIANPDTQNQTSPPAYTEVMAVQAGGELAYTSGTSYKFTPNQAMSVTNSAGAIQHIAKDVEYTVTINSNATVDIDVPEPDSNNKGTITLKSLADFRNIDSNTFEPVSDGLYIFRRNADLGADDDFEFSGYYVKTIDETQHFFALEYDNSGSQRSSNVLSDTAITYDVEDDGSYTVDPANVKLFAAKQETIENSGLTWEFDDADSTLTVSKDNIKIIIALNNLGAAAEEWTAITDTGKTTTFYYNNDLEEGASTSQLVESVTMDSSVTQNDYIAFDFDLNVLMESVQVAIDENGNEGFTTVNPWSVDENATYSDAKGAAGTVTNSEIELIAWSDAAN